MQCTAHLNEAYTNFCTNLTCLHPLCPECIDDHIKMHKHEGTHAEVGSVQSVKNGCVRKLDVRVFSNNTAIQILQQHLNQPNVLYIRDYQKYQSIQKQQIEQIKRRMSQLIDEFCQQFLKEKQSEAIPQSIVNAESILQQLQDLQQHIKNVPDHRMLSKSREQLDKEEILLDSIRQICQLDVKTLLDRIEVDMKKETKIVQNIFFDEIQLKLSKFIYLSNKPYEMFNESNIQSQSQIQEQDQSSISIISSHLNLHHSKQSSPAPKKIFTYPQLKIEMGNYFINKVKKCYLHFFQQDSNILHLVDLDTLNSTTQLIKTKISIPQFHRSIVTSHGDVYLIGGKLSDNKSKSKQIYYYEPINRVLLNSGQLREGRSSFGIVYVHPHIYIVSGLNEQNNLTKSCEKYNVTNAKLDQMKDCLLEGNAPLLINFQDREIWKFQLGLNLERYIINRDQWEIIRFKGQINSFYQFSSGCQINQNQLVVFGGYDKDLTKQDTTYLITVEENEILVEKSWNLREREGFWNPQAIVYKSNRVISLQNIEVGKDVNEKERRIIILEKNGWNH